MLVTHKIDLAKHKTNNLTESYTAEFASDIKYLLTHVLSGGPTYSYDLLDIIGNVSLEEETEKAEEPPKIEIVGDEKDIKKFAQTIAKEKDYAEKYLEHGLGSEELRDSKLELEKTIHDFETATGLKWPLK
jgi:hypothetical protein